MSLRYLLDTDIASYYLRRSSAALEERVNQGLLQHTLPPGADPRRTALRPGRHGR